jgi:hypothetical protein
MGVDSVRFFCYNEPVFDDSGVVGNTVVVVSEDDIRRDYYPKWKEQLKKVGKDPANYTFDDCLDDWRAVNWAWESRDE